MKANESKLYTKPDAYMQGPECMRNEVDMWYVASATFLQSVMIKQIGGYGGLQNTVGRNVHKSEQKISVLDACCGLGNFPNHLSMVYPNLQVVGVDKNDEFIHFANEAFGNKDWTFMQGDVCTIDLDRKFDFVTASSAYHHIEDERKVDFLTNMRKYLDVDGKILLCENMLPSYDTSDQRTDAIHKYYTELKGYYAQGNATPKACELIEEVYQLELSGNEEHKVDFNRFKRHCEQAGLEIEQDRVIWQPESFRESNAGSHVFLLRKK